MEKGLQLAGLRWPPYHLLVKPMHDHPFTVFRAGSWQPFLASCLFNGLYLARFAVHLDGMSTIYDDHILQIIWRQQQKQCYREVLNNKNIADNFQLDTAFNLHLICVHFFCDHSKDIYQKNSYDQFFFASDRNKCWVIERKANENCFKSTFFSFTDFFIQKYLFNRMC